MLTKPSLTGASFDQERSSRPVHLAAGVALVAVLIAGAAGDLFGAPACARREFNEDAVRTVSMVPSPDGDLLVLDFRNRQIVRVDLPDGSWGAVPGAAGQALKSQGPETIYGFGGGLLVRRASTGDFVELDGRLGIKPGKPHRVTGIPDGELREVRGIFLLQADGRDLVVCGDLYLGGADPKRTENWRSGVVRIPLDAPKSFEVLREFDIDDRTVLGCRLALPLIANLPGRRSYLLALEDRPRIYELRPGAEARPLTAFPERFAFSPSLGESSQPGKERIPDIFSYLENATTPVGLFGWEGALYLLTRSPAADRGTDWWLTRIDPATDTVAGTVRLATRANHLMVVPGDPYWALIEKGPVENSYEDQDITGIVAVPAERIRAWKPGEVICGPTAP
ncbi:MAG: hypothetical protein ACREKH_06735 [Candidatus Rokuibacteriota bacterium]